MSIDEELKKKQEAKAREIWIGISPTAKQCKTCIFAKEDTEYTVGAEMDMCDVYSLEEGKPTGVLWDGAECEWHVEKL